MKVRLQREDFTPQTILPSVGWSGGTIPSVEPSIRADDVSGIKDGVRYFFEGALVGMFRSLAARTVRGNLILNEGGTPDPDIFLVEPDWDGSIIPLSKSASQFCISLANQGFYVIAPTILAFDTPYPQYIWRSKDASPATGTDEFAVLIPPYKGADVQKLVFRKESGG